MLDMRSHVLVYAGGNTWPISKPCPASLPHVIAASGSKRLSVTLQDKHKRD